MIFDFNKLQQSRNAGYSDEDIWEYLYGIDPKLRRARNAGYSLEDVSSYFEQTRPIADDGWELPKYSVPLQKPKEIGQFEGIVNAAKNAFASSQQALKVVGGITPEEAQEISKIEYKKSARQLAPAYKKYQEAEGWDAVNAFINDPLEISSNIIAEGLAGSIPSLASGLTAGAAGAAIGAPTVIGAPAGFLAGQVVGTFAGSLATEYGNKVLEELQNEGMDLSNPNSIKEFFSNQSLVDKAKNKALKKGVPIAAFEAVSAGIGGKVGKILGTTFKTKPREALAEMAVQSALGAGGEITGSAIAGDEFSGKDVFAEIVGSAGPDLAQIGVGKARQIMADKRKQRLADEAAKISENLDRNNAPLTSQAIKVTTAKSIVEGERKTIEQTEKELADEMEKFAPKEPEIPTKEEFKKTFSTLTDEQFAETENIFISSLESDDKEEVAFARAALEAAAEVRAEKQKAAQQAASEITPEEKLSIPPTTALPVPITPETQIPATPSRISAVQDILRRTQAAEEPLPEGPTPIAAEPERTVADAIRDKDTFIFEGRRGAISEEDGITVFRPFGTTEIFEVPVNPNQAISEIEGIEWARKGQTRAVPAEPTKPEKTAIIESMPEITQDEIDAEADDFEVPQALTEIERSPTLNTIADVFDTGESRVVRQGKRARKVSETPDFYRQISPEQIETANRQIDNALRIIDNMPISEEQKQELAEPYLLIDQDIANYESNPEYQRYKASIRKEVRPAGEAVAFPETITEVESGVRELEQRARAAAPTAEVETAASLSRVADNTATDEEVVRLARQGLVNIQDGQNVITPRGEEVMQRGGAPLPRLTPEERAAEVAAVPAIVEQASPVAEAPAVTPAPVAEVPVAALEPREQTVDLGDNIKADFIGQGDVIIKDKDGERVGRFESSSMENGLQAINVTFLEEDYRGKGIGQKVVKKLRDIYGAIASDVTSDMSKSAKSMWINAGAKIEQITEGEDIQSRYVLRKEQPAVAAAPAPTPVTTPPVTEAVTPAAEAAPTPAITEEVSPIASFKNNIKNAGLKYLTYSDFRKAKKTENWENEGGVTIDESYYPTAVVGDTSIAFTTNGLSLFKNRVEVSYEPDVDVNGNNIFTIERIVTPENQRGKGSASNALSEVTKAADKAGLTLQLEPAAVSPLIKKGGKGLTNKQLVDWYKRNGFVQKFDGSDKILIRNPQPSTTPAVSETITPAPAAPTPTTPEAAPAKKIIAYRGDKAGIQEFEMKEGEGVESDFGKGPYLSSSKRIATSYAAGADEAFAGLEVPKGREVYTTEVDIKKPLWVWYGGVTEYSRMPEFFASKEFQALAERVRATKDESAIFNLERAIKENGFRNYKGATFALANPFGGWEKAKAVFKEVGFDGIAAQLGSDGDPSIQYVPFAKEQVKIVKEQPQVAPVAPAAPAPVGIAVGEPAEVAPPTRAEQPVIDPIGYGNALIDLFPTLKAAGVRAISMEESLADIERKWQQKQKSGKATRIDQLVYLANKKNTEDALAGNRVGGTWSRTDLRVAVSSSATPSAMAHEIGHAIMEIEFSKADKKTRDAIEAEYTKWFKEKYGKEGTPSVADQKRIWEWMEDSDWLNPKAPTPLEFRNPNWERYRSSFGEWFADEVAKWATTREKPKSLIDKFFSELAAKLSRLWNAVSENFSPNETLASWLDSITVASPSKVDPVTEGFQVGGRVGNKNARFLTYTIVEALPQNEAEKRNNERSYRVRDKKGKVTTMGSNDLVPLQERLELLEAAPEPTPAPEAVVEEAPAERPKRKTKIQSIIEATTGVKRPISRITVNEMTALKDQIKMRARRRREDKRSQREFADALMSDIKALTMRGKVRPTQLRAITSKALRTQFDNDKSVQNFIEYFGKVIENANYEADLKSARDAQKSASVYKKRKNIPGDQIEILDRISRAEVNLIDDPLEFATAARDFMKAFLPPISREYSVIPNKDMNSYLDEIQEEIDSEKDRIQNEILESAFSKVEKDEKLTRAEMKAYMGEEKYASYLEQQSEERRAKIEKALNAMANQSKENLINYEPTDFTENQMKIVKTLRKADVEGMNADQKREYIQFVDSIVANNTTYGAEKVAGMVESIAGINQWLKDKPKAAKGRAAFEVLERVKTGLSTFGRSVPDIFRDIFKKTSALGQIQQRMGLYDLTIGQVEANGIINDIEKLYENFYAENNKKYPDSMTKEALLAEGITSYLIQREPQTDDAQSVKDRIRKVQTIIDRWKENDKTKDHGDVAQVALDKLAANSSDEVLAKLKEQFLGNYKSLVWMRDTLLPKYKPMLKEFDENFQNQSSNYDEPNYLPISYIKKFVSADRLNETNAAFDNRTFRVTQIASSIKRKKMENIPKDMDLDLNIRRGVFNSLAESISKAKTAPAWNKIISFLDAEKADIVFGTEENKQMVLNILTGLKTSRERRAYMFEAMDQLVDTIVSGTRTVASSLALGGVTQPIRQLPEQLWSTAVNVGLFTLGKNILPQSIKAANPLLSRYSIGQRGDVRAGTKFINQAESAYNRAEKYMESSKWLEGKDKLSKANQVWMTPLTWADVAGAKAAWMSYYQQYLRREKIPFLGWDKENQLIDTDTERQAAALYAESITDIYQGASDPTRMALFAQRGKSAAENALKAMFFSFNSFAVQAKSRFFSDARDLVSNTTDFEDKVSASRGLAATIGGMAIFAWVNTYVISAIYGAGVDLIYAMLGVDQDEPDEEEKKKDADFKWKKFISKTMSTFFMSGGGQFAEEGFIDALNYASYFVESRLETENVLNKDGTVMSYKTYERTNAPFWRYKAASTAPVTLGLFEIPLGQVEKMHDIVVNTFDEDKFENLTEEEKRIISFNSLVQFFYITRLLGDVDLSRISERAVKDVEKQAKEREEGETNLQRAYFPK